MPGQHKHPQTGMRLREGLTAAATAQAQQDGMRTLTTVLTRLLSAWLDDTVQLPDEWGKAGERVKTAYRLPTTVVDAARRKGRELDPTSSLEVVVERLLEGYVAGTVVLPQTAGVTS